MIDLGNTINELGARKGLFVKIIGQKQNSLLFYIAFWALSRKNLGAKNKSLVFACLVAESG